MGYAVEHRPAEGASSGPTRTICDVDAGATADGLIDADVVALTRTTQLISALDGDEYTSPCLVAHA
jgi:hypothetical protein